MQLCGKKHTTWEFSSGLKRKPLGFVATCVLRPFGAPIGPRPCVERCPLPVVTTFDLFLDCRITLQARKHHSRCEALVAQCGMQMADGVFEALSQFIGLHSQSTTEKTQVRHCNLCFLLTIPWKHCRLGSSWIPRDP